MIVNIIIRHSLLRLLMAVMLLLTGVGLSASAAETASNEVSIVGKEDLEHLDQIGKRDEVNKAIEKGLVYLGTQQDLEKGHMKGAMPNVLTALSCLAYMAAGHFPGRSKHGENLHRGIMYQPDAHASSTWIPAETIRALLHNPDLSSSF